MIKPEPIDATIARCDAEVIRLTEQLVAAKRRARTWKLIKRMRQRKEEAVAA